MGQTAIVAENISKVFHIGNVRSLSLHESLAEHTNRVIENKNTQQDFYALRNISFEIQKGTSVGIIGRNGAGKSTLLKILSRITKPTTGKITIDGRLSSLLEVGTGFHPELTGRENIYLNGVILGMKKSEIRKKFDEIVNFSEIERFIDTPVKRYSSGMYVRLGFAVAAYLEPEILIIDEVLAVGDTGFQKKCIEKMNTIVQSGRTILFVSHNLSILKSLCTKGILIKEGQIVFNGKLNESIDIYNEETSIPEKEINLFLFKRKEHAHELIFNKLTFEQMPVPFGKTIIFKLKLKSTGNKKVFENLDLGFNISDKNQCCIIHCRNKFINANFNHTSDQQEYLFEIENNLKPGIYHIVLFLRTKEVIQDFITEGISLEIGEGNPYNYYSSEQIQGNTLPTFSIKQN